MVTCACDNHFKFITSFILICSQQAICVCGGILLVNKFTPHCQPAIPTHHPVVAERLQGQMGCVVENVVLYLAQVFCKLEFMALTMALK